MSCSELSYAGAETDVNVLVVLDAYIEMSFKVKGSKIKEMSWKTKNPQAYTDSLKLKDWGHFAATMIYFKDYWKFCMHS